MRAIRRTTHEKFGPVRSVKPTMVFEIGFEGIAPSTRHKAGIAVRFPRMLRIARRQERSTRPTRSPPCRACCREGRAQRVQLEPEQAVDAWFAERGWKPFPFQREVWKAFERGAVRPAACGHRRRQDLCASGWPRCCAACAASRRRAPACGCCGSRRCARWPPTPCARWRRRRPRCARLDGRRLRTGDTGSAERARQTRSLPSALVTTPESLSLLLSRPMRTSSFKHLRHGHRRRMARAAGQQARRAGATGAGAAAAVASRRWWSGACRPPSATCRSRRTRCWANETACWSRAANDKEIVVDTLIPKTYRPLPLGRPPGHTDAAGGDRRDRGQPATLVFTNTRSQSEIWYQNLLEARPDWAGLIALHHGSLDQRRARLGRSWSSRTASLKAVVCTSSLDLGVDFLPVERVLQIGSCQGHRAPAAAGRPQRPRARAAFARRRWCRPTASNCWKRPARAVR